MIAIGTALAPQFGYPQPWHRRRAGGLRWYFRADDVIFVRVKGVRPPQQRSKLPSGFAPKWQWVSVRGAPQAQVVIVLRRDAPIPAIVGDTTFAVPADGGPITGGGDASVAVPSNGGDSTVVRQSVRLE